MRNRKLDFATTSVLTNAMSVGLASTYSSFAIESMKNGKLSPDDDAVSWIGSCLPCGAIIGAVIAGYLSNKVGRKDVLMYLSLFLVGGWLTIAYANSLPFVYLGRIMTGMCIGLICVVTPMYVVEISTPEERGRMGTGFQLFICLGIIVSLILGRCLAWNWVAIGGAVLAIVSLLILLPFPESPRWLVMQNKQVDAVHAVNFLYSNTNNPSVNELLSEVSTRNSLTMQEIWHPTFYKPALLSIALMFFQQFSGSYVILNYNYFRVSLFKARKSSVDPIRDNIWMINLMIHFMVFFTFFAAQTMDKIGRKISLYISGFITFISLNAMSVYLLLSARNPSLKENWGSIPDVFSIVYIAGFSFGLGPIPWFMMSEMSPLRFRGLVCGLGTAFSWTFVFIISKSFLRIEAVVGDFGAYWIYSAFCLLTCFFTLIFIPETKGKTLEEIENYFIGGEPQTHPLPDLSPDQDSE